MNRSIHLNGHLSIVLICALAVVLWLAEVLAAQGNQPSLQASLSQDGNSVLVQRGGVEKPIITQVAQPEHRPYLHPIVAPDGRGELTQFSPDHHRHQTGIYWGFTRLNGRDFFHHPEAGYWRRVSITILKPLAVGPKDSVQWQTVYDLLDAQGQVLMRESQIWTMRDENNRYVLDLQWSGQAEQDLTIGQYNYGGLFVRMPWDKGLGGQVINSARQRDLRAEGERSVWVDVGIHVPGREDQLHITIFDHPSNVGYPLPWRVDSELGVGPARSRSGDWTIAKGKQETIHHRLIAYTGTMTEAEVSQLWSQYSGHNETILWDLAQQQARQEEFLSPEKAVAKFSVQDGIQANLFAAEPMIAQPMAFCWDARGRLWIAENRDYESRQTGFANDGHSRILILEDTDRDGVADSRKVFLEGIPFPSAIAVGMDGLWLGAPPHLLFVPDRNHDDRGDMDQIEVRLTGWGIRDRHETLNSLHWGPDGWLYGLQGFATPSLVGKPKAPNNLYKHKDPFPTSFEYDGPTVEINGGVWRYHPIKQRFEAIAHGFSNPWGIDHDAYGQLFITACVIPHLWHVIPGGIYHRQGGRHFNPYIYNDIKTIAEHRHRSAHGGARVYQSDALDPKYQGRVFMANIHEHAVLTDILHSQGSGYKATHGDDFALANNAQWVGFSVEVGPDGSIYALDWHDADICGEDVLHKETGRVFRFTPQQSRAQSFEHRYADLNSLDDLALAKLHTCPSVWHANQSRTILQHRSHQGRLNPAGVAELRQILKSHPEQTIRLRALWTLHATNQIDADQLEQLLSDQHEYVRAWAIQFLCEEFSPSISAIQRMLLAAEKDDSPIVRLYLAAAAQRIDATSRWQLLQRLVQRSEDNSDHNIPKMVWFALEGLVMQDLDRAIQIAASSKLQLISRHIARRICDGGQLNWLAEKVSGIAGPAQLQILLGMRDATDGRFDLTAPPRWPEIAAALEASGGELAALTKQLSQQFGDSQAAQAMLVTLKDPQANVEQRRQSLQQLSGRKRAELKAELPGLLDNNDLRRDAIRAMAAYEEVGFARTLLARYATLKGDDKIEAIYTLASRGRYARELTNALQDGRVPKADIPAHVARMLRRVVGNHFIDVWGSVDELSADKAAQFAKYGQLLTEQNLSAADLEQGRELFSRTCGSCHLLQGQGGKIGPDITGANRGNLEYLLSNILTPSSVIQDAYRMHIILMDDGRIYSGIPADEDERTVRLYVVDQPAPIVIPKASVESREIATVSMMPDGLLANLSDQEVVNLVAYLQSVPATK